MTIDFSQTIPKDGEYTILVGSFYDKSESLSPINWEVLDIIGTLKRRNYKIVLLSLQIDDAIIGQVIVSPFLRQRARKLGISIYDHLSPDEICKIKALLSSNAGFDDQIPLHPRDAFTQIDDCVYINPVALVYQFEGLSKENKPTWHRLLGKRKIRESYFAEGGRTIVLEKMILASNIIRTKTQHDYKTFCSRKVYFLDLIDLVTSKETKATEEFREHIDYFVNGFDTPQGAILVVNKDFYEKNKEVFEKIKKEQKAEIVFVTEKEKVFFPTGFVSLPNGKILLTPDVPKTIKKIEELVDETVITTQRPIPHLLDKEYSLRCFTNILF